MSGHNLDKREVARAVIKWFKNDGAEKLAALKSIPEAGEEWSREYKEIIYGIMDAIEMPLVHVKQRTENYLLFHISGMTDYQDTMLEEISAVQHDIWSNWMKYLYSRWYNVERERLELPVDELKKWQRQMQAPYHELSEKEKDSDREQARKVMAIFRTMVQGRIGPVFLKDVGQGGQIFMPKEVTEDGNE